MTVKVAGKEAGVKHSKMTSEVRMIDLVFILLGCRCDIVYLTNSIFREYMSLPTRSLQK